MGKAFLKNTADLLQKKHKRKQWQKIMISLSLVVALLTSCLLIHPAITMSRQATCGQEEHTHTEKCYEKKLICNKEEQSISESSETEGEESVEAHTHSDACYENVLICGKQEHTHSEACYPKEEEKKEEVAANTEEEKSEDKDVKSEDQEDKAEEKTEDTEKAEARTLKVDQADYTVEVDCPAEANIPKDAKLNVREIKTGTAEYNGYYEKAQKAVASGDETDISFARFFDISFEVDGKEIEPEAKVEVKITYDDKVEVPEKGKVKSVHFGNKTEVLDVKTNEKNGKMDEVKFDADSFSVYAIVGTIDTSIMLRKIFEDENYIITAGYTAKAEIPDDAKFIAEEITKEDDAEHFAEREAQSCEILNDKDVVVKALLNIGFYQNDVEIEPADTVQLTIQFKNENEYQEGQEFSVVHFTGEVPEVVAEGTLDENSSISCSVESFSEFTITGSDGTEYTIKEIENPTALNATVKLFNYTGEINSKKLGEKGYKFHNSNSPTVDGNDSTGSNNKPTMKNQLGSDKYPAAIINNQEISFDDLFNDTQVGGKTVAGTMKDGGGLFQKDKNGYYEYDSAKNAAYYDGERRKFVLYDGVIRPSYNNNLNDNSAGDIERGNFLPFNVLSSSSVSYKDVVKQSDGITNAYKLAGGKDASEGCTDLWFGMTVEFNFYMPKDGKINGNEMIFDFKGDDDVFVYIDDNLVLDIGGTHAAQSGSINFATGEVTDPSTSTAATLKEIFELKEKTFNDYSQHTLKFFYLERGGNISYCRLRFNMPTIPENSLTVAKNLVTDGTDNNSEITDYLKKTLTYKFRVLKADDDGNPSTELFIREGTSYTTSYGNEGIVGENGIFELKDGESATFENMASIGEFDQYVVEELLPDSTQGQYSGVEYNLGETTGNIKTDENAPEGFTGHYTDRLRVDATNVVGYSNKVDTSKLCSLNIKKEVAEGSMFPDDKTFRIQVMLGGEPLPANTQYTVGSDTKTVTEAGIIELKDGETAKILGILSGTTFEIEEVKENNYRTSYTGTISYDDNKTDINVTADGKVTGDFPLKSTVDIVVHNSDHDFTVDIPIYKQYVDNVDGNTETFTFKLTRVDENGTEDSSTSFSKKTTLTVTGDQEIDGKFIIGYENGEEGKYYYKITEIPGANKAIQYDSSYYIVGVSVSGNTANIISIKKNGQDLGESGKVAFVNKSGMNVVLKKVDTADSTKVLANARFDLYGSDYHNTDGSVNPEAKIMKQITTSTEGTAELGFLKPGTYYLVETQAPDGYNKLTEPVTFNITRDGLKVMQGSNSSEVTEPDSTGNYMLVVTNSTGIELPHTGGIGTFIYTLSGLLLMAIALMYGFVSRRRREGRLR